MAIAILVFVVALALIASERVDRTKIALLGACLLIVIGTLDQEEAIAEIAQTLGEAFGAEVKVRPAGTGFKVELDVADPEEAAALAARITR